MKGMGLAIFLSLFLLSCSSMVRKVERVAAPPERDSAVLSSIRIQQWGMHKFSGLLAVNYLGDTLHYAMLDSTGVTLLETEVDLAGKQKVIQVNSLMKSSKVPGFLSTALRRIYLLEPIQLPCSHSLLLSFCNEQDSQLPVRKYLGAGPFTLWEVQWGIGDNGLATREYSQPLVGVRIYINDLK